MRNDPEEEFEPGGLLRLTPVELVREIDWLQADLSERRKRTPQERRQLAACAVRLLRAACGLLGPGPSYPAEARIVTVHADFVEAFLEDYRSNVRAVPQLIFSRAAEFAIDRLQGELDAVGRLDSAYWHYHLRYCPSAEAGEEGLRRALSSLYEEAVLRRLVKGTDGDVL